MSHSDMAPARLPTGRCQALGHMPTLAKLGQDALFVASQHLEWLVLRGMVKAARLRGETRRPIAANSDIPPNARASAG